MRRKRRQPPAEEFLDPLSNYDEPMGGDDLERSLREDTVTVIKSTPISSVSADTTVAAAMKIMAERDIACLLVVDHDHLMGVFSERDVLNKIADGYEPVKDQPVSQFMTAQPVVVHETDSAAKALNLMAVGGFRHVPVLDVDEKLVGVLGPRRITTYLKEQIGIA